MATTYRVWGMHCAGCEGRLVAAARAIEGVTAAQADAKAGTLTIEADRPIARDALSRALSDAGSYALLDADSIPLPLADARPATGDGAGTPGYEAAPGAIAAGTPVPTPGPVGSSRSGYKALAILIAYLAGASVLGSLPALTLDVIMAHFMGGFFLAFSFFKFLDLRGFALAYARYDLIAGRWAPWRYLYPFVELVLGVLYLGLAGTGWLTAVHLVTLVLMLVGAAGVIRSLGRKDKVRCACLGAVINLPVGAVTLIEDLGMAGMAGWMLWMDFVPAAPPAP